jgi:hypothetical protein
MSCQLGRNSHRFSFYRTSIIGYRRRRYKKRRASIDFRIADGINSSTACYSVGRPSTTRRVNHIKNQLAIGTNAGTSLTTTVSVDSVEAESIYLLRTRSLAGISCFSGCYHVGITAGVVVGDCVPPRDSILNWSLEMKEGRTVYTVSAEVMATLPNNCIFPPIFHSCYLSRVYVLKASMFCRAHKKTKRSISLSIAAPLQTCAS